MCGIVATIGPVGITPALDALRHRGTEIPEIAWAKNGSVGHVRLPIVGLGDNNRQPVQKGQWTIAYVGEVFDFDRRLGDSDLWTVVRSWEHGGPRGLTKFDGFWSIVAIDGVDGDLYVTCDYLAQKPTYWRQDVLAAASELDAIALMGRVTLDAAYLAAVVKWGYCPDPQRTPYQEVKRVLPGETVVLRPDGSVNRYLTDPLRPTFSAPKPDQLKHEIVEAVRRRVQSSDVPVAILLSGGLDSSIVHEYARRFGNVHAYYSEDGAADEFEKVRKVMGAENFTVCKSFPTDDPVGEMLDYMQEPLDLGSLVPQIAMAKMVQERVCLTGDGADEMFGGYGRSQRYDSQGSDVWHELVAWHLPRLDRVMMRHQVEVRTPFLARRVVEMALALPREERTGKKILRDLFRDDLPVGIADGPKVPLRTQEVEWDREGRSKQLVDEFVRRHHARNI